MHKILVVDDERSIRESFSLILQDQYHLHEAATGEAAVKAVADQKIDLAYLDIRMPGMDGIATLKKIKEIDPQIEIIMITAVNDVQKASQAVRLGARDYIVKPFDVNNVLKITEQILRKKAILSQGLATIQKSEKHPALLLGQNEKIREIIKIIDNIKEDQAVLISGETGTEKEIIARLIHEKSKRAASPFKAVHLSGSLSPLHFKALLFGSEKGSSIADLAGKSGLFEELKTGTILLNNLESLPEDIFQAIAAKEFSRLGTKSPLPLEVRLIGGAAVNFAEKNKKVFEFFSNVYIQIPPLRERNSDLPLLIDHYINKFNNCYGREVRVDSAAVDILTNYAWPGNAEELESLIERLVLTVPTSIISPDHLPLDLLINKATAGNRFTKQFETKYIKSVFEKSGRDLRKTANYLGINQVLLETKLR